MKTSTAIVCVNIWVAAFLLTSTWEYAPVLIFLVCIVWITTLTIISTRKR